MQKLMIIIYRQIKKIMSQKYLIYFSRQLTVLIFGGRLVLIVNAMICL